MMRSGYSANGKGILAIAALAAFVSGLCCLMPVVFVMLGLATLSVAADLGNILYGEYRWAFRLAGLIFLVLALVIYFRRRGVCTLDQARRERNRIFNVSLIVLVFAIGIYTLWTYVVVHYGGIAVGLPWAQYDEAWALPASAALLGASVVLYLLLFRTSHEET